MGEESKGFLGLKWGSLWEHFVASVAAKSFLELIGVVLGALGFCAWFGVLIRENWPIAIGNTVVLIAYVILWRRSARKHGDQIANLLPYKSIAESCGIEGFHPLKTQQEKKAGWGVCVEKINAVQYTELAVAVFTGASTFAFAPREGEENHRSPLREALENYEGHLKILLMQPDCAAWEQCIKAFGNGNEDEERKYRIDLAGGYQKAIEFCDHLARKDPSKLKCIEVRTCDRPPLLKLVIMGNYIWLQHYFPGEHVDDRPAYIVRRGVKGGMAHSLKSIFDYRWEMSHGRTIIRRDESGTYTYKPRIAQNIGGETGA